MRATYVQAVTVIDDNMVELESIDDLIRQFNEVHNITGHKIGLLLLGDPHPVLIFLTGIFLRDFFKNEKSSSYSLYGF
jgi:hypothetical protein